MLRPRCGRTRASSRPLRARDPGDFNAFWCGALAAADAQSVRPQCYRPNHIRRKLTVATINYFLAAELFGQAEIYAAQRSYAEAQAANDQALRLAAQVERKEILFKAQLLAIDLRVALGQRGHETPATECARLLDVWPEDGEQAAIYYQLWRLAGSTDHQSRAAELYHQLYARTPNVEYRQRIQELTGTPPPEPPALPPPIITQQRADLGRCWGG